VVITNASYVVSTDAKDYDYGRAGVHYVTERSKIHMAVSSNSMLSRTLQTLWRVPLCRAASAVQRSVISET
jgi:hypothetical protein